MESDAEDLALRNGVPIQVHAYISPAPVLPGAVTNKPAALDASNVRLRDGKVVELTNNADVASLRVDHAYYQPPGTERDVIERSLLPLVKACVEGVNTAFLAVGSLRSNKSELLFRKMDQYGLIAAIFQSLLSALESKATTFSSASGSNSTPRYSFTVRISIVELYEETILDLLAPQSSGTRPPQVSVVDGNTSFKQLKDATLSPPIRSIDLVRTLVEAARLARRKETGLYGNAMEFSSAIVRAQVHQTFEFQDRPKQQIISTLDIVDLPPTDRFSNSGGMVRLAEGPLLNKSLFALHDCLATLCDSQTPSLPRLAPFDESRLTQLLQDALGGNCLSMALLFFSPGDAIGSRGTLQLGERLQRTKNLPVVNNDVIRGLLSKYFCLLSHAKQPSRASNSGEILGTSQPHGFVSKIHELEGKLAQETLEKRLLKEDKDKIVSVMNELKVKYQQLFDNELEIRKELLACEQEKLTLSKAFVDFQMEKNAQIQDLDSEMFEAENKLIQAEEMVVQIQQDDNKKASQIQDLCQKMNEIIQEKRVLGEELALLQRHCQEVEQKAASESKKNQQLSLELIVAVNQRQKSFADAEAREERYREVVKRLEEFELSEAKQKGENDQKLSRISELEREVEAMRKEIARKEIDIEKLELVNQRVKIDLDRRNEGFAQNQETERAKALTAALSENAALNSEKMLLQQQLERAQADLSKLEREKEGLNAAWIKKSHECEELMVSNERLQHDIQSQVEEFRLKLSFIVSKASTTDGITTLVQSYQSRERELRNQVALLQQRFYRMRQHTSAFQQPDNSESPVSQSSEATDVSDLRERLHNVELQVVEQMNTISAASEREGRLQSAIEMLKQEKEELQRQRSKSPQTDRADLEVTREMQNRILQQLQELRTLSQIVEPPSPPQRQKTPVTQVRGQQGAETQIQQLLVAKRELEQKIASNQAEWMQSVEQVERRCADLLTKNVMLTEENEQLRNTLKSLIARIHRPR